MVLADTGEPKLIDLKRIRAAQPMIHIEEAVKRIEGLAPADLLGIARVTLPVPPATPEALPLMFDPPKNAYIVSSANPNLRVISQFNAPVQGPNNVQMLGVGFAIAQAESYLSVVGVNGRYFLRDGYHRAYGLLHAGHQSGASAGPRVPIVCGLENARARTMPSNGRLTEAYNATGPNECSSRLTSKEYAKRLRSILDHLA
jgi:hypothetical protein